MDVHPAPTDRPERPQQTQLPPEATASTVKRLHAVLWHEREVLESLVAAHARQADDPEIARLTAERRTTSLLRLVESAQLADELGLPPESIESGLDVGWEPAE